MNIPKLLKTFCIGFSLVLGLTSCQPGTSSNTSDQTSIVSENAGSESPVSENTNTYYNGENFLSSDRQVSKTKLVTYPGPSLMESSKAVSVKVDNEDLFVYQTRVNHGRVFTWEYSKDSTPFVNFSFEGKIHVEVTFNDVDSVESAVLRPLVYGISPSVSGKTVDFDLDQSGNYVLEINNDSDTAVQIFANPLEENPLTEEEAAKDSSILYVGPGVYNAGAFPVKSNQTIYLAGGAYVYGQFSAEGISNLTLRGRGIVSGSIYSRTSNSDYTIPVVMRNVRNLTIEGLTFIDPAGWTLHLWKCSHVRVNNVKIITARANGDGISVQSCTDVRVKGGYVRTWDDSLVVKNSDNTSSEDIHFDGTVVWTDLAQSMEVGYETYGASMKDISFENITVVHNYHKAVISCHNSDQADITGLSYKNITVEDASCLGDVRDDGENDFLIDFTIAYNADWSKSGAARGTIDGVNIDDVKVYSKPDTVVARMQGESEKSDIKNIAISGLEIEGKQITGAEELGLTTNGYVSNVTFAAKDKVLGARIQKPYELSSPFSNEVEIQREEGIEQGGLLVPEFARYEGELSYIGEKVDPQGTSSATHGAGKKATTAGDDGSGAFEKEGHGSAYAFDGDASTYYESKDWTGEDEEFAALTFDFDSPTEVGTVRIKGNPDNLYSYTFHIGIFAIRRKSNGEMNTKYTRLLSEKDFTMSPSNGNVIDINLAAQDFKGLQLRFGKGDSVDSPKTYQIGEVEFYPPSLSFSKAVVDSTEHNDVYPVEKLVDGDPTGNSYYESKTLPAHIVIDLGDVYSIDTIVLALNPSALWSTRVEEIKISVSDSNLTYSASNTEFTTLVDRTAYTFDPATGNRNLIRANGAKCRYLRLDIYSNSAAGGYGAQLSEVSVYGGK